MLSGDHHQHSDDQRDVGRVILVDNALLCRIESDLKEEFHIEHSTIQFESGSEHAAPCGTPVC